MKQMSINFTGDFCSSGLFKKVLDEKKLIFSESILSFLTLSDVNVFNFEGPETKLPNYLRKDVDIRQASRSIQFLNSINNTILNFANNHIFDSGIDGFLETQHLAKAHNVAYFGAGSNKHQAVKSIIYKQNGVAIALIGVSHQEGLIASDTCFGVCSDCHKDDIIKEIRKLKNSVDWVVLNYHGGEEFVQFPMPKRRKKLKKWLKHVDIVVAHHSHSFQGVEHFSEKKAIFYSLGNFVFDIPQHKSYHWVNRSAILRICFQKSSWSYTLLPIYINTKKGLVTEGSKHYLKFIKNLSKISYYSWLKSCYKVVMCSKKNYYKTPLRNNSKKFYFKIFDFFLKSYKLLLLRHDYRPVYLGYLFYKFLKLVKIV